jgi:Ca2+-binding RTX toxin-like protein
MAQITNSTSGFNAWDVAAVTYTGAGPGISQPNFLAWATNGGAAPFNQLVVFSAIGNIDLSVPLSPTGTIDSVAISSDAGTPLLSITDMTVQLSNLFVAMGGTAGWEAFWETVLAGTTTFNLTAGPMNMMGDYAIVNTGQTKAGAVDTFTGALNNLNGYLSGDAINVQTGATLTGAADIFSFNSIVGAPSSSNLTLVGDVGGNSLATTGRVNGGADRFTVSVTQSQFAPVSISLELYGDVASMAAGGVLVGGADVISLTNVNNIILLTGDSRDSLDTTVTGGADSIVIQTNTASMLFAPTNIGILSGDAFQVSGGSLRGGGDNIDLQNVSASGVFGDVYQLQNATLIGGNDAIVVQNIATAPTPGSPPISPSTVGTMSGDAGDIGGTGDFTGGSDTINLTNIVIGQIFGDVNTAANGGFLKGGNDIINYTYNYFLPTGGAAQIFGDVQAANNVSFTGGNDTITINGSRGPGSTYQLVGDAISYNPSPAGSGVFTGGNDIIAFNSLDPTSTAILIGDLGGSTPINTFKGGNDQLVGGAGNDRIFGDNEGVITATTIIGGNDVLNGRDGDDLLDGGAGSDTAAYNLLNKSIYVNLNGILGLGTGGDYAEAMGQGFDQLIGIENVIGSNLDDVIVGDSAGNLLSGEGGNDKLDGGLGSDNLSGGLGADQLIGGDGVGEIDYARYDDANYGNLTIRLDAPNLNTGAAAGDTFTGIEGLVGGLGNDTVVGNASANFLFGGGGNDNVYGQAGADYLNGGAGTNNLYGGAGADQHIGGTGIDYARYDDANWGNLTIRLDGGANVGAVAVGDTYTGIEGLVSGLGNDILIGSTSNNQLFGGGGSDYIDGRAGSDYLNGGAGADRFVFATALGATNIDTIADFVHLTDDIVLSQAIFAGIGTTLDASEFQIGAANAATDRIIYNNITGQLFYDANGNAAGGQTLFATVTAGTVLSTSDFVMV